MTSHNQTIKFLTHNIIQLKTFSCFPCLTSRFRKAPFGPTEYPTQTAYKWHHNPGLKAQKLDDTVGLGRWRVAPPHILLLLLSNKSAWAFTHIHTHPKRAARHTNLSVNWDGGGRCCWGAKTRLLHPQPSTKICPTLLQQGGGSMGQNQIFDEEANPRGRWEGWALGTASGPSHCLRGS